LSKRFWPFDLPADYQPTAEDRRDFGFLEAANREGFQSFDCEGMLFGATAKDGRIGISSKDAGTDEWPTRQRGAGEDDETGNPAGGCRSVIYIRLMLLYPAHDLHRSRKSHIAQPKPGR
jgi:hypothetical protein